MKQGENTGYWTEVIEPSSKWRFIKLKELFGYRDLLIMLVKRDFIATYKQTILGPIWFFVQPILTTIMFVIVFGNIANISTDSLPKPLFYLAGVTIWNYFSECLIKTSTVFKDNAAVFGKVYFPRLILPLSIVVSNLFKFFIQFVLFLGVFVYYLFFTDQLKPNLFLFVIPLLVIFMAMIAMGLGMLISALTTKYRDLVYLLTFGVQLLMYASPIIYPMQALSDKAKFWASFNPLSSVFEIFRYAFTGYGFFSPIQVAYSLLFGFVSLLLGILVFNKVEKSFIDTV